MGGARTDRRPRPRLEFEPWPGRPGRVLCRLSAATSLDFERVLGAVAEQVERSLGPEVIAGRIVSTRPLRLEDWRSAKERFVFRAATLAASARCRLVFDVADCYGSLDRGAVASGLQQLGASDAVVGDVASWLAAFAEAGVRGLPVGPAGVEVLCNAALAPLDRSLRFAGVPFLRWIDDVVVFPSDPAAATRAIRAVSAALRRLGLRANPGKCAILPATGWAALGPTLSGPRGWGSAPPRPGGVGVNRAGAGGGEGLRRPSR